MGCFVGGDLLWGACRNDCPAAISSFGTEIDDPVGGLDDIEIVLDDDDRVAFVAQSLQDAEQLLDIVEVKAGRWLVQNVKGAPGRALGELLRELHTLRFAAR